MHFTVAYHRKSMSDDDSPIFRRRPVRKAPIIPPSTDSRSQGLSISVVPLPAASSDLESAVAPHISDDDSPLIRRRPLRNPPIMPLSPNSPSQAQHKLAVPPTPGSSESAVESQASGSRWNEARQRDRVVRRERRQRFLNNKLMAHQAVEVNEDGDSVDGTTNSEDDGYFFQYP